MDILNRCWYWQGIIGKDGYGKTELLGRTLNAHRFVYMLLIGEIPKGCDIHHICENKACVNPKHLKPVSKAEHLKLHKRRKKRKKRMVKR